MFYTHVIAAVIGAALAATCTWQVQEWRAQTKELARSKASLRQLENAHAETIKLQDRVNTAQTKAALRERSLNADRNRLTAINSGLRDELATARRELPDATCDSTKRYATALSDVLGECTARLSEVAGAADRSANEVMLLRDSWPTNGAVD